MKCTRKLKGKKYDGVIPEPPVESSMTLIFDTSLGDGTPTIGLPLSGTVDVMVDWGDGNIEPFTTAGYATHTYAVGGTYTVKINGSLQGYGSTTTTYNTKITRCTSFGNIGLQSLTRAFSYATNLIEVPAILPDTVYSLCGYSDVYSSATYTMTSCESIFFNCHLLNDPNISSWVININIDTLMGMFAHCYSFNQPLNSWDVSNVTEYSYMFCNAFLFNQPLSSWDMTNAYSLKGMFSGTPPTDFCNFNQDISMWNVSNVYDTSYMFAYCLFNQNIGGWAFTNNVTSSSFNFSYMFFNATTFNQNLNSWKCGKYGSEPTNWSAGSALTEPNKPIWGTHTGWRTSGSYILMNSAAGTTTATMPAHSAGDLIIAFAFRDGSVTLPTQPAGWTSITSGAGTLCSMRVAYKVAASSAETTETWTSATTLNVVIYRGSFDISKLTFTNIATSAQTNVTNVKYLQNNAYRGLARTIVFSGARETTRTLENAPYGLTLVRNTQDTTDETALFNSNILDDGIPQTTVALGGTATTLSVVLRLPNIMVAA